VFDPQNRHLPARCARDLRAWAMQCSHAPRLYSEYNLKNLRKWATSENYCLAMPAVNSNVAAVMRTDNIHQHVI
jgi:hypothetical protein